MQIYCEFFFFNPKCLISEIFFISSNFEFGIKILFWLKKKFKNCRNKFLFKFQIIQLFIIIIYAASFYRELSRTVPKLFDNRPCFSIALQFVQVLLRLRDAHRFCRFFCGFLNFFLIDEKKKISISMRVGKLLFKNSPLNA